jgi:Galactose mutarotase and related enzymes
MKISIDKFGVTPQGEQVDLITFENESGAYMKVTSYGAKLVSLVIPDKNGELADVVLGYNDMESYLNGERFFGSNPGPFANRIKDASFTIDGQSYHLTPNEGANLLHSGSSAIEAEVWSYAVENDAVTFSCSIPDGKYGFPGDINISICYKWSNDLKLSLDYRATSSKATHINLTHHSYFNLNGDDCDSILDHIVSIDASSYLEKDDDNVPTGKILAVEGTPLDLRTPTPIGKGIDSDFETIKKSRGYDHCYIIDQKGEGLAHQAHVLAPLSGRTMDVFATLPGVQLYTDNFENGVLPGKHGKVYPKRSAFCLEPQFYPNSPNIESFPSTLLRPGREYNQTIVYQFNLKH